MTSIVIDRLNEEDFRRAIENRLREKQASVAIERLRRLLAPYAGPGKILSERFLTVETSDFVLSGWEALDESIRRYDRPGSPITAISIAFGWPGEEPRPRDASGHLSPYLETRYFTDAAFPFSESTRDDLLDGYSSYGCTWGDDCEATDTALSVGGIDDLHTALTDLEEVLLGSDSPDEDGLRAGSLGACLLSALLVQAVSEQIDQHGLPRPLCVMSGSSGVYPFFDAPVAGMPVEAPPATPEWFEDASPAVPVMPEDISQGAPACRYSSLLMTGIPRAKKRAVLVLEEDADEMASRIARLRSNDETAEQDQPVPAEDHAEPPVPGLSGASPLLVKKHPVKLPDECDAFAPSLPVSPEPPVDATADAEPVPVNLDADDWLKRLTLGPLEPERGWSAQEFAVPEPAMAAKDPAGVPPVQADLPGEAGAQTPPAPPRRNELRAAMAAVSSVLSQIRALWRGRNGPAPTPRKRFPPR